MHYLTREAAVDAVEHGYTESFGGEHPVQTRYVANKVKQVGESHWWVMGHSCGVSWGSPPVERWNGPSVWLYHIYEVDGEWAVKHWDAFYGNLTRHDCPPSFIGNVPVNAAWRLDVSAWWS